MSGITPRAMVPTSEVNAVDVDDSDFVDANELLEYQADSYVEDSDGDYVSE